MKSSDLIRLLAGELTPVQPGKTRNDLLLGLSLGAAVSLTVVVVIYGVQPGLVGIAHGGPFAMKASYALSLAAIAGSMLLPMLRPGNLVPDRRGIFALTVLLLAGGALLQTAMTSDADAASLWLGRILASPLSIETRAALGSETKRTTILSSLGRPGRKNLSNFSSV
ncbi:NrsF family protein [Bradyrhizobium sp.]|uniref:NrsF family protein n=1 Tax=Bradyrhizobium sp. TaxID=376 RepID=UPI003C6372E4